jgi:pimeloyl-ACP methyl ester carboxylesterase
VSEQYAEVGDLRIAYQTIGQPADPPLLLIMGLGMQLIHWDRELCEQLAERGFRVIRFDNRDSGHSSQIDAPVPNLMRALSGLRIEAPYLLSDMADDAFGLLDRLGVERAHVAGASMGGMIAQAMAIRRPQRLLSLASIMSTTGSRRVGRPKLRVWSVLTRRAPPDRRGNVEHFVRVFRMIGSPAYPTDRERIREVAAASYDRGHHPAGTGRQLAAIIASGDRTPELRRLHIPTVVIHGTDDPLVPLSGGRATARAIPDAELVAVPGMGHDLPRELWPLVVDTVVANAERAGVLQAQ